MAEVRKLPRESVRWGKGVKQVESVFAETEVALIHIMDSEADDIALFCKLREPSRRFVVRGYHDRKLAKQRSHAPSMSLVTQFPTS